MFRDRTPAELVALILAVGIAVALNLIVLAAVWTAISTETPLGENATQVLTGWGGGVLGVLGAYIGYQFGRHEKNDFSIPEPPEPPKPPKP